MNCAHERFGARWQSDPLKVAAAATAAVGVTFVLHARLVFRASGNQRVRAAAPVIRFASASESIRLRRADGARNHFELSKYVQRSERGQAQMLIGVGAETGSDSEMTKRTFLLHSAGPSFRESVSLSIPSAATL